MFLTTMAFLKILEKTSWHLKGPKMQDTSAAKYGLSGVHVDSTAKAQSILCAPQNSSSLAFLIKRSHYQAAIWRQANRLHQTLLYPEDFGWQMLHK